MCQCRTYECYKSTYIDARGESQNGVEVLPATKASHNRADQRNHIQEVLYTPTAAPSNRTPFKDPQDSMIDSLAGLVLNSHDLVQTGSRNINPVHSRTLNSRGITKASNTLRYPSSGAVVAPLIVQRESREKIMKTDIDHQVKETIISSEICNTVNSARANGVQEIDCSEFFLCMIIILPED